MKLLRAGIVVVLVSAALAGCSGTSNSAYVGTWGSSGAGKPSLTLTSDGKVSGNDGCNTLSGTWTEKNGRAEFGPFASTLKACNGVDTWLSHATSALAQGSSMTVYNSGNTTIGTLDKQ